MTLDRAVALLNVSLEREQPRCFNSSWISTHAPAVYRAIAQHARTPLGDIDWDRVTRELKRPLQRRWMRRRLRCGNPYTDPEEVSRVLGDDIHKRYVFLQCVEEDDRGLRDRLSSRLVRLAQKGNTAAKQELLDLLRFTVDAWIESCPPLRKWRYERTGLNEQIEGCIRRFRYAGSFMGYLFKTLLLSGRGLPPLHCSSLDAPLFEGQRRTIDNVVQHAETGEIQLYRQHTSASSND